MLSAAGWLHNAQLPADVNGDNNVSPLDAVLVINHLSTQQQQAALATPPSSPFFVDVNNDQFLSPLDAVLVINQLAAQQQQQQGPLIRVSLQAVHTDCPAFEPLFAEEPAAVTIAVPELVTLRGFVEDLRGAADGGVRSAYFDLLWNTSLLEPTSNVEFGENFPNGQSGDLVAEGIDELGAVDSQEPTGPGKVLLFTVPLMTLDTGTVTFTMEPADGAGHVFELYDIVGTIDPSEVEFASLEITIVNGLRPQAVSDQYQVTTDNVLQIGEANGLLGNDVELEEQPLSAVKVSDPQNGTVSIDPEGSFTYTPNPGFVGMDVFSYSASDGVLLSCPASVTIQVTEPNEPPVAVDDEYTVAEDTVLTVDAAEGVLANDTDEDGDVLTAVLVDAPTRGSLDFQADGSFVYTPDENFNGTDTFTYLVTDGSLESDVATVTITVTPVNDAPVAQPDSYTVEADGVLTVSAEMGVMENDFDVEGDSLTAQVDQFPANGSLEFNSDGSFVYTPDPGFSGQDSFAYFVSDGQDDSDPQTVLIEVTGPPLVDFILTITALDEQPLSSTVPGGQFLLHVFVQDIGTPPRDGIFSPYLDVMFDAQLVSVSGPIAYGPKYQVARSGTVDAETGLIDELGALAALGEELGPDALLVAQIPFSAVAPGTAEFAGDPADIQPAHEVVPIGEDSAVPVERIRYGTASIEILEGERPDAEDDSYTVAEDQVLIVSADEGVLANDSHPDEEPLVAQLVSGPEQGTLELNADGSFVYTPDLDFFGTDTFTYVASDAAVQSDPATVTIEVTAVDDPPVAVDDQYQQPEINQPLVVDAQQGVLANDVDPDSELTAELIEGPEHGTLTFNADGSFTYTPAQDFLGVDQFLYVAVGDEVPSEPATVTIEVGDLDAPASISGLVFIDSNADGSWFVDSNGNGVADSGEVQEMRLGGVTLQLEGTNIRDEEVLLTAVSDRNGFYEFTDLIRGEYSVMQIQPLHLLDGQIVVQEEMVSGELVHLELLPGQDVQLHWGELGLAPEFIDNSFFFASRKSTGVMVAIGPEGQQDWFSLRAGWSNYQAVDISLSEDLSTVRITAVRNDGEVLMANVATRNNPRVAVKGDAQTGFVVQLFGPSTDFNLQLSGSSALNASAVDAAFAG